LEKQMTRTFKTVPAIALAVALLGLLTGAAVIARRGAISSKPLALAAFAVAAMGAGFLAWFDALRGARMVTWEPTPRPRVSAS